MNLFYAVLAFVMVLYNYRQASVGMDTMNYVLAVMWLTIGIFCIVRYLKDRSKAKKRKEHREREE